MKSSPSRRFTLALCRPVRVPNTLPSRPVSCSAARHPTQRRAGKRAALQSGRRQGAVVTAQPVSAEVGGKRDIASVSDTARAGSKSQRTEVGLGPGVATVSLDQQTLHSGYASFQVRVERGVGPTGGVLTSTDAALDNKPSPAD